MLVAETFEKMDVYLEQSLLRADPVLEQIARNSEQEGLVPHAVTPLQAEFLAFLIRMIGARRVLEIGCLGGYSAVAMARALPEGGEVLTTEIDTRTARVAQANLDASGFGDRVRLSVGPAMETLKAEQAAGSVFDFVFIDADKVNHRNYFEMALKMTRPGAVIVADNVVRGGAVLNTDGRDNSVRGIRELMAYAQGLEGVEMTALQTVGAKGYDGMALFRVSG